MLFFVSQAEELRLRDEHVMYEMQEAQRQRARHEEILEREEVAKKRVAAELKEKRKAMNRREVGVTSVLTPCVSHQTGLFPFSDTVVNRIDVS